MKSAEEVLEDTFGILMHGLLDFQIELILEAMNAHTVMHLNDYHMKTLKNINNDSKREPNQNIKDQDGA